MDTRYVGRETEVEVGGVSGEGYGTSIKLKVKSIRRNKALDWKTWGPIIEFGDMTCENPAYPELSGKKIGKLRKKWLQWKHRLKYG